MANSYQGKFIPRNPKKYEGNPSEIIYRSSWELSVMFWLDVNDNVKSWTSESIIVPYLCPTDGKAHRYYVDFKIVFCNGKTLLVELKPKVQSQPPRPRNRTTKKYITEVLTWVKNEAKWKAATEYALDRKWEFKVWTEDTLKQLGIRILTESK